MRRAYLGAVSARRKAFWARGARRFGRGGRRALAIGVKPQPVFGQTRPPNRAPPNRAPKPPPTAGTPNPGSLWGRMGLYGAGFDA